MKETKSIRSTSRMEISCPENGKKIHTIDPTQCNDLEHPKKHRAVDTEWDVSTCSHSHIQWVGALRSWRLDVHKPA